MRIDRLKLRLELAKRDMKQQTLAEKAGLTRATINGVCNGRSCTDANAYKIANALDIPIEQLLEN